MISPIWTAVVLGLLFIGMRLLQGDARAPKWLRAVRPDLPFSWTVAAVIVGVGVIAALDFTGAFRAAITAPETPILVIAAILMLQVAVLLSMLVIRRRRDVVSR